MADVMLLDEALASAEVPMVAKRFMRYAAVASGANPKNEEQTPSNQAEFAMAELLKADLEELGLAATVDEHAYVLASLPASAGCEDLPALGLLAHLDTSYDAPNVDVKPQVVSYEGGPLVMGEVAGKTVQVEPAVIGDLNQFVGQKIITSDGSTILSADDKAGVAEIMQLVAELVANPELAHPTLKIAFVPDEEIGHGASLLDLDAFGATWAYTVDGEQLGEINYECFSACQVAVKITGAVVHPGSAKNKMINALTVWREFDQLLPAFERPEHTEGYEGYFHCLEVVGKPNGAEALYIVRDFDAARFDARVQRMERSAAFLNERYGADTVTLEVTPEYRNMAELLVDVPFLIEHVKEANRSQGVEPVCVAARGGTDGAQLTFRGLPCPNIATGGYEAHSVREFIPVSSLETTVQILINLVARFAVPQV